jgi:hypothetical protein
MKKLLLTSVITIFLLSSCLVNKYEKKIKGSYTLDKAEYIMLNDSSIIEGFVNDIHLKKHVSQGSVYIKGTKIGAFVDTSGYFKIKIAAGEYVLIASSIGCTDMPTQKISFNKNEKKSITFHLGTHVMYEK